MAFSPVVLFVYNRPWHTKQTVEALQKNKLAEESELFIYSDAAKNGAAEQAVSEVRDYIGSVDGCKSVTIIEREKNWGLADSIIDGVTTIINQYGRVIVLEDDLVTSPYFLKFMNDALDTYKGVENIYSITGFSFSSRFMRFPRDFDDDVYLNIRPMSWSWGTWKSEWEGVDWDVLDFNDFIASLKKTDQFNQGGTDLTKMLKMQMNGQLDSWYIRWTYDAFKKGKLTVYPRVSFINNVGHDNTGVHCGIDHENIYSHTELNLTSIKVKKKLVLNNAVVSNFNRAFNLSVIAKIKRLIKRVLKYAKIF